MSACQAAEKSQKSPPVIKARAAIVINVANKSTLFEKAPDKRLPPASTTKIMTALLFARKVPADKPISTSPLAASMPGSKLGMQPGDTNSKNNLMHAILLISANDASVAAAEAASGSVPKFVQAMNDEAKKDGAPNTHFTNPHGLQNPNHLSTARDLANIALAALNNPEVSSTVKQPRYSLPGSGTKPARKLKNTDDMLQSYPGLEGVKTGWTRAAGYCFVGAARRGNNRIITVVLHSPNWQKETAALLNYGFSQLSEAVSHGTAGADAAVSSPSTVSQTPHPDASHPSNKGNSALPDQDVSDAAAAPISDQSRDANGSSGGYSGQPKNAGVGGGSGSIHSAGSGPGSADSKTNYADNPTLYKETASRNYSVKSANRPDQPEIKNTSAAGDSHSVLKKPHEYWWWLLLLLPFFFLRKKRKSKNDINNSSEKKVVGLPPAKSEMLIPVVSNEAEISSEESSGVYPAANQISDTRPSLSDPKNNEENENSRVHKTSNFIVPEFTRFDTIEWLESIFAEPVRLLDPLILREAKLLLMNISDQDYNANLDILNSQNIKIKLAASELFAGTHAAEVETTLQNILNGDDLNPEVQESAIQQLSALSGERFETQALQILFRENSLSAAVSLLKQNSLSRAASKELKRIAAMPFGGSSADIVAAKSDILKAYCTSVLMRHGETDQTRVEECLHHLPEKNQEIVICKLISEIDSVWSTKILVQMILKKHSVEGMQTLLHCTPSIVQTAIEEYRAAKDAADLINLDTLGWMMNGSGDPQKVRALRDAGVLLAAEALRPSELHHFDPAGLESEQLCAALQIFSLRLGYTSLSTVQINGAFKSALDGEGEERYIQPEYLKQLAAANTHPEIRSAVQYAAAFPDGKNTLLTALMNNCDSHKTTEELTFWQDKCGPDFGHKIDFVLSNPNSIAA